MRKFLVWPEEIKRLGISAGMRDELSPLSFEEFDKACKWSGANDIAWRHFLRHNHFNEIDNYSEEALMASELVLEPGEPIIDLDVLYGDD